MYSKVLWPWPQQNFANCAPWRSGSVLNSICFPVQARMWLGMSALVLQIIYLPNAFYKMKWDTIISAHCASVPTEMWTRLAMEAMIAIDFVVASMFPFHIMMFCNVELIMRLSVQKKKVKGFGNPQSIKALSGYFS